MEPYHYECPKSILKLLTPTDNELANEWREKCYEYHKQKAEKKTVLVIGRQSVGPKFSGLRR